MLTSAWLFGGKLRLLIAVFGCVLMASACSDGSSTTNAGPDESLASELVSSTAADSTTGDGDDGAGGGTNEGGTAADGQNGEDQDESAGSNDNGDQAPGADQEESQGPEDQDSAADAPAAEGDGGDDPTCGALETGVSSFTLDSGGAVRNVRIYVPSSVAYGPLPAVLNWHGRGGNGNRQARSSGYEQLAEAEGFIAVHPTGIPTRGDGRNGWELIDIQDPNRDDIVFANELLDELVGNWCVDSARVFSTGFSNGGFFTARLVCEMPGRLAGAVSVGGLFHPAGCAPSRAVPFRAYHGTADSVVPFNGGGDAALPEGLEGVEEAMALLNLVMPDEFAKFAADAGCGEPTSTEISSEIVRHDYPGCAAERTFFEIVGGGHSWPGASPDLSNHYTTQQASATVDSWTFFTSVAG